MFTCARDEPLLVLDNCEHLAEACARLADRLLASAPDLRVLATSREPLAIQGEVLWRVPSLDAPDLRFDATPEALSHFSAVRLFLERAQAVRLTFGLTADNALAVAQVCSRLDGIPLAIELAAARVRVLSAEQVAARLVDSFELLTGGSRTAPNRQQTLEATLDWSFNLLSAPEQAVFRRLAVFAGGPASDASACSSGLLRCRLTEERVLL
jgi:predicted ATPase